MQNNTKNDIYILSDNGEEFCFNLRALQDRLIKCFNLSGREDSTFLVDDIALAVEYTLFSGDRKERIFGVEEFGTIVVQMLEDIGFPEVAKEYRTLSGVEMFTIACKEDIILDYLKKMNGLFTTEIELICERIIKGCKLLEIENIPPKLLLELARFYDKTLSAIPLNIAGAEISKSKICLVSVKDILSNLSDEVIKNVEFEILNFNAISSLFPNIRLEFRLKRLALLLQLRPILTELEISSYIYYIGEQMGEICNVINKIFPKQDENISDLPINLSLPDITDFAVEYLKCERFNSKKTVDDLVEIILGAIPNKIYKVTVDEEL